MAVNIKIVPGAIGELLKSSEVRDDLDARAAKVAAAATGNAGSGAVFGHDSAPGRNRARASVWTENYAAIRAEATNRALTRAIDAGR